LPTIRYSDLAQRRRLRAAAAATAAGPSSHPYWRAVHATPEARRPNTREDGEEMTHRRRRRRGALRAGVRRLCQLAGAGTTKD
jgi:predicted aconitase